jgi:outer membrane protein TolC
MNYQKIAGGIIAVIVVCSPFQAFAADLFLDTCLRFAEARDKKLIVSRNQIELAQTKRTRAGRSFFPAVSFQRKVSRGSTYGGAENPTGEYQSEETGLRASQSIFEAGRLKATYRYESLNLEASRFNYTKQREELFSKVKLAYFEMLSSKMEYEALRKAFDEIDYLAKKVRLEFKAKAISELDLAEAENLHDKVENLFKSSELSYGLSTKKLTTLVNIGSLNDIPEIAPESLPSQVPEISFTLADCQGFIVANNIDLKICQSQIEMANQKKIINRSKAFPKFSIDGSYGRSGEHYVAEPLQTATVWSLMGRMTMGFLGSSIEMSENKEHTNPNESLEPDARFDTQSSEIKIGFFDDLNQFVDNRDAKIAVLQANAEYEDIQNKAFLDFEKAFDEYLSSMRNIRTLKDEMDLKERKLKLMRRRNELYEVSTVQVMEESWKYSEAIASYAKTLSSNYSAVTEMERMTLISLR